MIISNNDVPYIYLTNADLRIRFEGKALALRRPLYRNDNRYFLPLKGFVRQIGGLVKITDKKIYILFSRKPSISIDRENNQYKFAMIDGVIYLSLFDACRILNLKSRWDYDSRNISLYWNKEKQQIKKIIPQGRVALIRFEDITAGNHYMLSSKLEKFRVIADYMFSSGCPFHIAWIPRFMDPPNGISNDISRDYSMANAHFLFTIEYLLNKEGIIGLHGYTHQYGDEVSAEGTEFSENRITDEASIRKRVEAAIDIANRLVIPYQFFESPHYASTAFQQSIYEFYFDIIYEGCVGIWGEKIVKSPRNHRTLYVPTPLGFVEGEDGIEKMLSRINNLGNDTLASLFYHPYAEFDYITLQSEEKGYPHYSYLDNSPLHRMVKALYDKGCKFAKVTEL